MANGDSLPELVRDSKLQAVIIGNVTIHARPLGSRTTSRHEKWVQDRILGYGGYGVVSLERKINGANGGPGLRAVKAIRVSKNRPNPDRQKYTRELEAIAEFSQDRYTEFFIKSYGWYESPGWLYIAMEYCEHGDLRHYLVDEKTLPESQAWEIAWQVLGALTSMHQCGFAHRDLKPANILVKSKPPGELWVKLGDFGLSKRHEHVIGSSTIRGTPGFMAPETIGFPFEGDPKAANPFSTDMWCFGETIFQTLVGHASFPSMQELHRYQANATRFPEEPLRLVGASEEAIDFVQSLMAPSPQHRLDTDSAWNHPWMADDGEDASGTQTPIQPLPDYQNETEALAPTNPVHDFTRASGEWWDTISQRNPMGDAGRFHPNVRANGMLQGYDYHMEPDLLLAGAGATVSPLFATEDVGTRVEGVAGAERAGLGAMAENQYLAGMWGREIHPHNQINLYGEDPDERLGTAGGMSFLVTGAPGQPGVAHPTEAARGEHMTPGYYALENEIPGFHDFDMEDWSGPTVETLVGARSEDIFGQSSTNSPPEGGTADQAVAGSNTPSDPPLLGGYLGDESASVTAARYNLRRKPEAAKPSKARKKKKRQQKG